MTASGEPAASNRENLGLVYSAVVVAGSCLLVVGMVSVVALGESGAWWTGTSLGLGSLVGAVAWLRYATATPVARFRPWAVAGAAAMTVAWLVVANVFFAAFGVVALLLCGGLVAGVGAAGRRGRFRAVPLVAIVVTSVVVTVGAAVGFGDEQVFRVVSGLAAVGLGAATMSLVLDRMGEGAHR